MLIKKIPNETKVMKKIELSNTSVEFRVWLIIFNDNDLLFMLFD
jgi:hypothetical protein